MVKQMKMMIHQEMKLEVLARRVCLMHPAHLCVMLHLEPQELVPRFAYSARAALHLGVRALHTIAMVVPDRKELVLISMPFLVLISTIPMST